MPPVIVLALTSLGVSGAVAGPVASLLFAGLSLVLSIIFAPDVPKPEAGRVTLKQNIPSRCRIIGRRRTGGAQMLFASYHGDTFYGVQAICEGIANAYTRFYLHDDIIQFSSGGNSGTVASQGDGRYGDGKIIILTRDGSTPETPYTLPQVADIWTADHRGDGIASVMMRCADASIQDGDQAKRFPFGLPNLSVEVDATEVFDPREEDQDPTDPATWSGSGNDNPILQAMWFLTAAIEEGGMGINIEEAFLPVFDEVSKAADICDEVIARKVGTEPRYTSAVLYHFNDNPNDILSAILGTCDGFCAERGDGTFVLKAGKWDDDDFEVVLTDKHIISLNVRRFRPDEDEVTGVIVKYNSILHEHTTVDAPVWPRDAYQGGEDQRVRTIEVTYCNSGTQAQRLSKRVAIYEMAPITGTAVLTMYGILLLEKRGATIQCTDDPALADCKVRLTRIEPNLVNGTVEIDFTVFDPDECDSWSPSVEEGLLQPVVTNPTAGGFSTPGNLIAVASQIRTTILVDVGFDPGEVAGTSTAYHYRWRIADIGSGVPSGWTTGDFSPSSVDRSGGDDFWVVTFIGMPFGLLEIQLEAHQHDSSDWSASCFVDTGYPAPGRPNNFQANEAGGDVHLTWTAPNSAGMHHARVYRAVSGTNFSLADPVSGEIAGVANAMMSFTDVAPASGTYDYWVVAETIVDIASLPRGPETVTVP